METKVMVIHAELRVEKGVHLYLPLEANIKKERVNGFEGLMSVWAKKMWGNHILFEEKLTLVEIELKNPKDLLICPNFDIVCFKENMYPGWGTFFSCWCAYEFGGCGLTAKTP